MGLFDKLFRRTKSNTKHISVSDFLDAKCEYRSNNRDKLEIQSDIISENEHLNIISTDDNGFICYSNGIKYKYTRQAFYTDSFIYDTIEKLGYNKRELFFTNHADDGCLVKYDVATAIAFWELFTKKLICVISNDEKPLTPLFINQCNKAINTSINNIDFCRFYYIEQGIKEHKISRSFIENVFNNSLYIPSIVDRHRIVDLLMRDLDVVIHKISEEVYENCTFYDVVCDGSCEAILGYKPEIELYFNCAHIDVVRVDFNRVRLEFPNISTNIEDYEFTFGGSNYQVLTQCLYRGFTANALSSIVAFDEDYNKLMYQYDSNIKTYINLQGKYYSRIKDSVKLNPICCDKFLNWKYESNNLTNYVAMAAYYKQCDVLLDDFMIATEDYYSVISKNIKNGLSKIRLKAYNEMFDFINGYSYKSSVPDLIGDSCYEIDKLDDNEGYIYLMINHSFEGLVKVGKSTRDPHERARELSSATGVPTPFILVYYKKFNNCHIAEKDIHHLLENRGCRLSDNREFFKISTNDAIDVINSYYNNILGQKNNSIIKDSKVKNNGTTINANNDETEEILFWKIFNKEKFIINKGFISFDDLREYDPLFEEAVRWIVQGDTASTSSLQRRYEIGYNRAGRIMDQMEAAGIVGPASGGKPRKVLVSPVDIDQLFGAP